MPAEPSAEPPAELAELMARLPFGSGTRATTTALVEPDDGPTFVPPQQLSDGSDTDYTERLARETARFDDEVEVHDLPPIFHYWSHRYLRPALEFFGVTGIEDYVATGLERALREVAGRPARIISIGAGNCDTELRVAGLLCERGFSDFTLECLEISAPMRERGRRAAAETGLADHVIPVAGDFNRWQPVGRFDGVIAHQSLHHVTDLEGLLDGIRRSLQPTGRFVTSDMIGRNGHQRWPAALAIVREFWAELPAGHRYNRQLRRQEDQFLDWDCSQEGFEGIRSQDVLPLLAERFAFEDFLAFGNVIDPFIDRGFGPHFDPGSDRDRDFIDRVHARDEAALATGEISPTHLIATMRSVAAGPVRYWPPLSPERCLAAMRSAEQRQEPRSAPTAAAVADTGPGGSVDRVIVPS